MDSKKKKISAAEQEAFLRAQEWVLKIHKSQIEKGLRPADGVEEVEEVDIVSDIKKVIEEVKEVIEKDPV
tara:strand:+ start:791 stop:1000 length:210 start_codon:yes stop_codon:yes gene_type:complete